MTKAEYKTTGMTIKKLTTYLILFGVFLICNGLLYPSVWDMDFCKKSPDHAITGQIVTTYANKPSITADYAETPVSIVPTATKNHPTAAVPTFANGPTPANGPAPVDSANTNTFGTDSCPGSSMNANADFNMDTNPATHGKSNTGSSCTAEKTAASAPAAYGKSNAASNGAARQPNDISGQSNGVTGQPNGVSGQPNSAFQKIHIRALEETHAEPPAPPREDFTSNQWLPFPFSLFCPQLSRTNKTQQALPSVNTLMKNHEATEEIVYIDIPSLDANSTLENPYPTDNDRARSTQEPPEKTDQLAAGELPPLPANTEPQETTHSPHIGSNADSVVFSSNPQETANTDSTASTEVNTTTGEPPSLASMLQNRTVPATPVSLQEMNRLDKADQKHDAIIQDLDGIKHKVLNDSKAVIAEMSEQPSTNAISEELDLNKLKEPSEKPETTMPEPPSKAEATAGTPKESGPNGLELLPDLDLDAETVPTEKATGSTAGTPAMPAIKPTDTVGTGDTEPTEFPESFGLEELEEASVNPHFGLREPVKVNAQKPATQAPATEASPPAPPTAPTAKPAVPALPSTNVNCGLEELPDEEEPTTSTVEKTRGPGLKELPGGLEELQEEPEDFPPVG